MSSAVAKKTVELFYDVLSPYSWIAFEELCRYRSKWNIDLKFRPFFIAGVMQGTGNKPPGTIPAKGAYMMQDLTRLKKFYQIPLNPPANVAEVLFVKGSLAAQRFLTAASLKKPELLERISRELWMRVWSRDEDITTPESLTRAAKQAGLSDADIAALLQLSKSDSVKEKLKQTTQDALDEGAFGAPTIVIHNADNTKSMVFGSDRGHIIAMLLGEKYTGPLVELAQSKL